MLGSVQVSGIENGETYLTPLPVYRRLALANIEKGETSDFSAGVKASDIDNGET